MKTKEKRRFLSYEFGLLTMNGALATRNENWPVYNKSTNSDQRQKPKEAIRRVLANLEEKYLVMPPEEEHVAHISRVAHRLTEEYGKYLFQERFRIGVAQKLINLHLKYLWCSGMINVPHHCPIDGIIRDKAGLDYCWTKSDSIQEYRSAINGLRTLSKKYGESIATWELREFRRRHNS